LLSSNPRRRPDMRVIGFSDVTTVRMAMLREEAGSFALKSRRRATIRFRRA